MKRLFIIGSLLFSLSFGGFAQVAVGEWRDHFALKNVDNIVQYNNLVYGSSFNGIIVYDLADNSSKKITKATGLSDVGISAIAVDGKGSLVVGYDNGNIDICLGDRVVNMRDLIDKSMQGAKRINRITIFQDKAYLSCSFGILVINISKCEVFDTYFLSSSTVINPVYQTLILNGNIYAASAKGIFYTELSNERIQIFSSWKQLSIDGNGYADMAAFNDGIVVARGTLDGVCFLQYFKNNLVKDLFSVAGFKNFSVCGKLFITLSGGITACDTLFATMTQKTPDSGTFLTAQVLKDKLFIGHSGHGLRYFSTVDASEAIEILPNGPNSNLACKLNSSSYGVWLTPGGVTTIWDNLSIEPYYSFFDGWEWKTFNGDNFPVFKSERDLFYIAINPQVPADVWISSWGSGIFRIQNNDSIAHYDQFNSILQNIFPASQPWLSSYVRVGGVAIDSDGNTWMTNSESPSGGIVVRTADDNWYRYDYQSTKKLHSQGQILVAKNGLKWSFFPFSNKGLFIWDDNGTIGNSADDAYRGVVSPDAETDNRNVGELQLWDKDKQVITNHIFCLAEDNAGVIWVGTDKGPLVYYRASSILSDPFPVATQINIARLDGSGLGDYLLGNETVNAIAIDAANRKWIGTESSGVFLISEDGTKEIAHFTTQNAPLPSNRITSISIQGKTGEIFVGTALGLVSYKGTSSEGADDNSSVIVFPNPVRADFTGLVTIKGVMVDSNIKITDVAGTLVNEMKSLGGSAVWDRTNFSGERVKTGVYFILVTNSDGTVSGKTKVMIIN